MSEVLRQLHRGRIRATSPNFSGPSSRERQGLFKKRKTKKKPPTKKPVAKKKPAKKRRLSTRTWHSVDRPKGSKVPVSKRKDAATATAKKINVRTGKPYTDAQRRAAMVKQLKSKKRK